MLVWFDPVNTETAPMPKVPWKRVKALVERVQRSWPTRVCVGALFGSGVPFRGTWIRPASRFSVEGPILLAGNYERSEIDFVHRYLPTGQQVIELGASIGGNSCQIARRLLPGVPMTCVEANPELIGVLKGNLARNHPGRDVNVVHAMVGDAAGVGRLQLDHSTLRSSRSVGTRSVEVPARTLADIVAMIRPGPYSLVCDIEGAEAAFLENPGGVLDRCTCIVMEGHATTHQGRQLSLDDVLSMPLRSGGWRQVDRYGAVAAYVRQIPGPAETR
jgi:FkbM family methyltransferase